MANTIYSQLGRALGQSVKVWNRSILYRGKVIPCMVDDAAIMTKLTTGGMEVDATAHIKIQRELVPIGSDGEPHTNETLRYPAVDGGGLMSREFMILAVVPDEFSYSFEIVDPSR